MSNDATSIETLEGIKALREARRPLIRMPIDLNIKKFKKYLTQFPELTKHQRNYMVNKYKTEGWAEFNEIIGYKGHVPSHSVVKSTSNGETSGK